MKNTKLLMDNFMVPEIGSAELHLVVNKDWFTEFKALEEKMCDYHLYPPSFPEHPQQWMKESKELTQRYKDFCNTQGLHYPQLIGTSLMNIYMREEDYELLLDKIRLNHPSYPMFQYQLILSYPRGEAYRYSDFVKKLDQAKYRKFDSRSFRFPNDEARSRKMLYLKRAFGLLGLSVVDVQRQSFGLTTVLTDAGDLWTHDTSHGGGGYFKLENKAKP